MDKLSVEQTIRGTTYTPATAAVQKQTTNLGGYAISFEELLQRVGARLDNAFSAADTSSGLINNKKDAAPREDVRDNSSKRDSDNDRKPRSTARDDRNDDRAAPATSKLDIDTRRDDSISATRDDNAGAAHSDGRGEREHAARDTDAKSSQDDTDSKTSKSDTAGESGQSGAGNDSAKGQSGKNDDQTAGAMVDQGAVTQQAVGAQAAAVLAAAIFNQNAAANTNTGDVAADQQVGQVNEAVQGMAAQAASQEGRKGVHNNQANTHQNGAAQKAAEAAAQQAAAAAGGTKPDAVKDQAAQLSRMIGTENRADVTVNVTDEKTQLTSKPTYTVTTDASLVAKERGADTHSGAQQQGGQQQNPNGQAAQQLQTALQQQGQAAQPGQATGAQQGGAINAAGANGGALSGAAQSGGASSAHAGGSEALGTASQSTTTSLQSQQAREAAPQHQPQRAATLSGAVVDQISVKITKALQAGTDRISIHLKPSELGRVDVKLEMTHDGRVMTVVSAEKQDTLDLLRRDSSELQRALADAGLQSGDMEFNLQGQEKQTAEGEDTGNGKSASDQADVTAEDAAQNPEGDVLNAWESGIFFNGRLDMRA